MCEASAYKSNKEFLADVNLAKKVAHNKSKELNFTDLKGVSNSKKINMEATSSRSVEKLAQTTKHGSCLQVFSFFHNIKVVLSHGVVFLGILILIL